MGKLIRGMDYRERGHRSGYEFVMLPRPFFIHAEFRNIKFSRDIIGFPFYSGHALDCSRSRRKFGERKFDL